MKTSRDDAEPKHSNDDRLALRCRICDQPVAAENAKTDSSGNAVHEECYAAKLGAEQAVGDSHGKPSRPWILVAAEVTHEQDPQRLAELVAELNQALDEQRTVKTVDSEGKRKPQ